MRKIFPVIFYLLLLTSSGMLAQPGVEASSWKGFQRFDFKFDQRDARFVLPDKPLPGNPWIWRARFPDWHTEADSILLSEGFHLAYINTNNQFGSPKAINIWDAFYEFLIQEYSLQAKVSLVGVSRGGLFVYNWAIKNPEKVASIYAEAPVCDFKSWPAGFGLSQGSPEDWKKLKKEYGFDSDAEAMAYSKNPLDHLENLAEKRVPVLHMVGLEDKIVPVEENTIPLVTKYIALGGIATVVPCTSGEQNLQGHHFSIETPRLVADFIKYNALLNPEVSSSDYLQ